MGGKVSVSISTSITLDATTPQQLGTANQRRQQLTVTPDTGSIMYVGDSGVTSSTGTIYDDTTSFDVYQGHTDDRTPGATFYAVGSGTVRVLEVLTG